MEQEYIVTLQSRADLDDFYNDMETPGGNLYIPNRVVDVAHRRPTSRNTHYMLTAEEAAEVAQDPRVVAVELPTKPQETWTQYSPAWAKAAYPIDHAVGDKNWGLLRCTLGAHIPGWGTGDTQAVSEQGTPRIAATVTTSLGGRGVDIVIGENGTPLVNHPEFWVSDTNQQSRVVQYNWYQHMSEVSGGAIPNSTYLYTPIPTGEYHGGRYDHATAVAGAAAGRTQGWAKSAAIYGIGRQSGHGNVQSDTLGPGDYIHDLIRVWHNSKPRDPTTGLRRPTIVNYSYGYWIGVDLSRIRSVRFRGTVQSHPTGITASEATSYGLVVDWSGTTATYPRRLASIDADVEDMISDGITVVSAAGNYSWLMAAPSTDPSADFNNYFTIDTGETMYYCRGMSPAVVPGVLCIGAASTFKTFDRVAGSTARGSRVTIFAPGEQISLPVSQPPPGVSGTRLEDPSGSGFYIDRISGTSFASPQVAGVLACAAESNPRMSPSMAMGYAQTVLSKPNQLTEGALPSGSVTGGTNLAGAPNKYLYSQLPRPLTGSVQHTQQTPRPSTGAVWPRAKNLR